MNRFDKICAAPFAAIVIFVILIPAWIVGSTDMVNDAFGSVAFFMTLYLYRERDDLLTSYAEAKVESATINGKLAMAQVEARATTDLATQMANEARALENIVKAKDAEIERLGRLQPHYGRDKKTGRFVKQVDISRPEDLKNVEIKLPDGRTIRATGTAPDLKQFAADVAATRHLHKRAPAWSK